MQTEAKRADTRSP